MNGCRRVNPVRLYICSRKWSHANTLLQSSFSLLGQARSCCNRFMSWWLAASCPVAQGIPGHAGGTNPGVLAIDAYLLMAATNKTPIQKCFTHWGQSFCSHHTAYSPQWGRGDSAVAGEDKESSWDSGGNGIAEVSSGCWDSLVSLQSWPGFHTSPGNERSLLKHACCYVHVLIMHMGIINTQPWR